MLADLSKKFAFRLMLGIEADCITYRHYIPWADKMIERLERPPAWVCDLATTQYKPDALTAVAAYVRSFPPDDVSDDGDEFVGYLWIRYERRELSWATFLNESGRYADARNGARPCEYFYSMLNELEEQDFSPAVEGRQRNAVSAALETAISRAKEVYEWVRANE